MTKKYFPAFHGETLSEEDRTALCEEMELLTKQMKTPEIGKNLRTQMSARLLEISDILAPSDREMERLDSRGSIKRR